MRAPRTSAARVWLSFHIPTDPLVGGVDGALVRAIAPAVRRLESEGRSRRFFFIRYWDGRPELRLRFRSAPRHARAVRERIEEALVERWGGGRGPEVRAVPYDRAEHYFGETMESVYSELLNEQTTALALTLLGAEQGSRAALALATSVALHVLWDEAFEDPVERGRAVGRAVAFADAQVRKHPSLGPTIRFEGTSAVGATASRVGPVLRAVPSVRAAARLVRRVSALGPRGVFVAVHAAHLLCNKVGLSIGDETVLYEMHRYIGGGSPPPPRA